MNEQYKRAAEYAAQECYGSNVSPRILAIKAYNAMEKAFEEGKNPYKALNDYLGTDIPEYVLVNV